ncbi:Speckle-type POZ protein-like [Halotydeus destructor]|nr:Speckle-type POZ protein-like [Halotydeus destructor]
MNPKDNKNILLLESSDARMSVKLTWTISCFSKVKYPIESKGFAASFCPKRKFKLRINSKDETEQNLNIGAYNCGQRSADIEWSISVKNHTLKEMMNCRSTLHQSTKQLVSDKPIGKDALIRFLAPEDVLIVECTLKIKSIVDNSSTYPEGYVWKYYDMIDNESSDFFISMSQSRNAIICVHRSLMENNWPHFRKMMNSNMTEARSSRWEVKDFDYCTMRSLVVYVYTGMVHIFSVHDATEVLEAARVYDLKGLADQVVISICSLVSVDDVLRVLPLAHLYELEDLKNKCFKVISDSLRISGAGIDSLPGYGKFENDVTFKPLICQLMSLIVKEFSVANNAQKPNGLRR